MVNINKLCRENKLQEGKHYYLLIRKESTGDDEDFVSIDMFLCKKLGFEHWESDLIIEVIHEVPIINYIPTVNIQSRRR